MICCSFQKMKINLKDESKKIMENKYKEILLGDIVIRNAKWSANSSGSPS